MTDDDLRAADIGDGAVEYSNEVERDAFIQRACGADSALIAKVRAYIAGGSAEPPFLGATFSSVHSPCDSLNGRLIGHWKLVRRLGEGGFGLVYLVERSDGQVRQPGAMKFLKGTIHGQGLELRFRDERQILADLNHRYIVGLIDAGLTHERQPYLVMDMVEDAQPIDDFCRNTFLTVSERVELFRQVCEAVQYAHEMKVIHHDLKPAKHSCEWKRPAPG